jgi:hypothetical protein
MQFKNDFRPHCGHRFAVHAKMHGVTTCVVFGFRKNGVISFEAN